MEKLLFQARISWVQKGWQKAGAGLAAHFQKSGLFNHTGFQLQTGFICKFLQYTLPLTKPFCLPGLISSHAFYSKATRLESLAGRA